MLPRSLDSVCSLPPLAGSEPIPEPAKGQNPRDLEPLPPIFSAGTLFSGRTEPAEKVQLNPKIDAGHKIN